MIPRSQLRTSTPDRYPGHEPTANGGRLAAQPGRSQEPLPAAHESSAGNRLRRPTSPRSRRSVSDDPLGSPHLDVGALVDDLPTRLGDRNGQPGASGPERFAPRLVDTRPS